MCRHRTPPHGDHRALCHVGDPKFVTPSSADGVFRILSCSFCRPVKRIDLMIEGIAALGRAEPARSFQWIHIGDGPEKKSLEDRARSELPKNVAYELRSYPGRSGLLEYYRSNPVDVFINTSKSEGTPVTIMEAISVGIPIVATSVGGNVEIVTDENGIVISADPMPQEIAGAVRCLSPD